jgi:hypothetical protein
MRPSASLSAGQTACQQDEYFSPASGFIEILASKRPTVVALANERAPRRRSGHLPPSTGVSPGTAGARDVGENKRDEYVGFLTWSLSEALFAPIIVADGGRSCEFCGDRFQPKSSLRQFCSNACRLKARYRDNRGPRR